jgi:tRNA-specific 2-thiouridylase
MAKVVVAMSGGVDSSVAAALLQEEGHEVRGMMLKLWSEPGREESNRCCTSDAICQARGTAKKLGIPFEVVDARQRFHDTVVRHFLAEYAAGRTPNPCLVCNRVMRWEYMLSLAMEMGGEFMATGHYVRLRKEEGGRLQLLRAADRSKDQSYLLHMLNQEQLAHSLFPVGAHRKTEIRALAKKFDLPSARRADSQDLCFLGGEDYRDFIRRNAPETVQPGEIQTADGRIVGRHEGLAYYTIGQRKGLGIASPVPLYVIKKHVSSNLLIVGKAGELGGSECRVTDIQWVAGEAPPSPLRAEVKTRYTAKEVWGVVRLEEGGRDGEVRFEEPVRDLTAGQGAVFFDGEVVLGGGTLAE